MCKGADVQKQTHSALNGKGFNKIIGAHGGSHDSYRRGDGIKILI